MTFFQIVTLNKIHISKRLIQIILYYKYYRNIITFLIAVIVLLLSLLFLVLNKEKFTNKNKISYAVILIGEYRNSDVVKNGSMSKFLQNADIFCGTYNDENIVNWKKFGKSIKFAFIDKHNPPLPKGLSKQLFHSSMYQWTHLDNVLKLLKMNYLVMM